MLPPVTRAPVASGLLTAPASGNAWQVGALLNAIVLSAPRTGNVRLQIGSQVVDASTDLKLKPGQTLQLRVAETGPRVVLRTDRPDATPTRVREGIRSALPRQALQAPLLAAAQHATRGGLPLPPVVQRAIEVFVRQIPRAETLTQPGTLRDAIRQSGTFLENTIATGPAANVARDWKAALLQLRQRLVALQPGQTRDGNRAARPQGGAAATPVSVPVATASSGATPAPAPAVATPPGATPARGQSAVSSPGATTSAATDPQPQSVQPATKSAPPPLRHQLPVEQPVVTTAKLPADVTRVVGQLIEHTEGALARVKLNQLASTPTETAPQRVSWFVELPVRHPNGEIEVVPLRIDQQTRGGGDDRHQVWSVNLAFDLGGGNSLRARVALRDRQVYTSFWTGHERIRASVENKLDSLRQSLEKSRIRVGCLTCSVATADFTESTDDTLLETRA